MDIGSIVHKALKDYIELDDSSGLKQDQIGRLRTVLTALLAAPDMNALAGPPGWRIHRLKGNRAGTWSISVSRNWRLTFTISEGTLFDLNLEDYH